MGHNDCTDSFDESAKLCTVSQCPADSFRCKNGACINADSFCNHVLDCADGSDEIPSICRKLGEMGTKMDTCPQLLSEQFPQSTPTKEESSVWQTDTCSLDETVAARGFRLYAPVQPKGWYSQGTLCDAVHPRCPFGELSKWFQIIRHRIDCNLRRRH